MMVGWWVGLVGFSRPVNGSILPLGIGSDLGSDWTGLDLPSQSYIVAAKPRCPRDWPSGPNHAGLRSDRRLEGVMSTQKYPADRLTCRRGPPVLRYVYDSSVGEYSCAVLSRLPVSLVPDALAAFACVSRVAKGFDSVTRQTGPYRFSGIGRRTFEG